MTLKTEVEQLKKEIKQLKQELKIRKWEPTKANRFTFFKFLQQIKNEFTG